MAREKKQRIHFNRHGVYKLIKKTMRKRCFFMMLSQGNSYFENNKVCQNCEQKMKRRFIGLKHCRCGMSQIKNPPGIVAIQPGGFLEGDPPDARNVCQD